VLSDKDSKSILQNVIFNNMTGLRDGLLELTGAINMYKGTVHLNNVAINNSSSEDALNIVKASISIKGLDINNTSSDAFDCDFCKGKINSSYFDSIGGDALDFSGSNVAIDNIKVSNVSDKGLSIGEASDIEIKDSSFSNIFIGIASKDASSAIVSNVSINNYELYAGMTYSKKNYYDLLSSLNFYRCNIKGSEPFLRQFNTELTIDGLEIDESKVNVEKLYSSGVINNG
jgi:hypothetical protein